MSKSAGADHSRKCQRRRQTRAAWRVFLKRPLGLWVLGTLLFLLPLTPALLLTDAEKRSNVPSYTRFGKELREPDDIRRHFESGTIDTSIVGLDFTWSYSFEEAGQLALQFPNVRWIRLTGPHFRNTSPDVFERLAELTSIELQTSDVDPRDIERLSQIASLRHIKLRGRSFDADLTVLKALPNLTSVHLEAYGTSDRPGEVPLSSRRHLHELAQISTLQEIALESPTVLTNTPLHGDKLTPAESQAVIEFANALSPARELRTIYVGGHGNKAARQALRELRRALPNVSVRPTSCSQEFFAELVLFFILGIFGMVAAGLHFVSCCTLPQAWLVPGSEAAHRRVVFCVVLILLAIQLFFLVMVARNVLAAVAVCAAWAWLACGAVACLVPRDYSAPRNALTKARKAVACYATVGLLVAIMFLGLAYPARIEWFMFGEQPGIAAAFIAVATVLIYRTTKPLQVHRRWAENGMDPAADMQSWLMSFGALNQRLPQGPLAEPHAVGWQKRLEKLTASTRSGDTSLVKRLRFWMMASGSVSLLWTLLFSTVFSLIPLIALIPLGNYLKERVLAVPSLVEAAGMMGMMLPIVLFFVTANLYARFPLFASEILMPVSRSKWRENVLLSTLTLTMIGSSWVWLITYVIRLATGDTPEPVWMLYSLLATIAFGVLGAGVAAWVVMVRRVVLSACCIGLIMAAVVPFVATLTEGEKYRGLVVSTMDLSDFWICIIGIELFIGLMIFGTAWRRWTKFELAA